MGGGKVENHRLREEDVGLDDLNPSYKHVWINNDHANTI